jgi:hypothetical protein
MHTWRRVAKRQTDKRTHKQTDRQTLTHTYSPTVSLRRQKKNNLKIIKNKSKSQNRRSTVVLT